MSYLSERIAYLRGMAEGMGLSEETNEGKMIAAILDFLDDMTEEVRANQEAQKEFMQQLAQALEVDEDDLHELDECDDLDYFDITCNQCGEEFTVDEDMLQHEEIHCPNCGEEIDIHLEECDCDEEGCHGHCDCDAE